MTFPILHGTRKAIGRGGALLFALFMSLVTAHAQKFEFTPLVGARFGGTMELQQTGAPNFDAHVADSITYGFAGGIRIDGDEAEDHDVIEFRWMRQSSHVNIAENLLAATPYSGFLRPSISINNFLGDFTHEFTIREAKSVQPFITGTLGAARLSAPASSATRFAFGLGAGLKIFPATHWGFRIGAEYLPIVMHTELQSLVCAGGCIVILNGGVMNQFEVTFGPAFRF